MIVEYFLQYCKSVNFHTIFPLLIKFKYIFSQYLFLMGGVCGLYYKTITIVKMTIVSDATIWSLTYDRNWRH
jgi:hypothetical protein